MRGFFLRATSRISTEFQLCLHLPDLDGHLCGIVKRSAAAQRSSAGHQFLIIYHVYNTVEISDGIKTCQLFFEA